LRTLARAYAAALGVAGAHVPDLPMAKAFSGGRILRVAVREGNGAVVVDVLAAAAGARRGAVTRTALDLADCHGDPRVALDFVAAEVLAAWRHLTRPDARGPEQRAAANAADGDAYHRGRWVPDSARGRRTSALDRASLDRLHRGRPAYLKALVSAAF
jgi:hypothetical protein